MKRLPAALAVILATAPYLSAQRPDTPAPPVIVVSGEAHLRVAPDLATVRLGVVRQFSTAQTAQDQANTAGSDILAAITKTGVAPADIQTSRLTLSPVYAPRGPETNQGPKILAYSASNVVSVRLSDLAKVGPVIDAGLKAGANEIQGVQFELRDDMPSRLQALKQAVTEARKKADTIADALGVKIGMPLEVSENSGTVLPPGNFDGRLMMAAAAPMASTPVSPGQLDVHATVTIRYQIGGTPPPKP